MIGAQKQFCSSDRSFLLEVKQRHDAAYESRVLEDGNVVLVSALPCVSEHDTKFLAHVGAHCLTTTLRRDGEFESECETGWKHVDLTW